MPALGKWNGSQGPGGSWSGLQSPVPLPHPRGLKVTESDNQPSLEPQKFLWPKRKGTEISIGTDIKAKVHPGQTSGSSQGRGGG